MIWHDPEVELPDTSNGEEQNGTYRVKVRVKLSDGTEEDVQFRRENKEPGGAFCGFAGSGVSERAFSGVFGEYWTEWIVFGETFYQPQRSSRTVTAWAYIGVEEVIVKKKETKALVSKKSAKGAKKMRGYTDDQMDQTLIAFRDMVDSELLQGLKKEGVYYFFTASKVTGHDLDGTVNTDTTVCMNVDPMKTPIMFMMLTAITMDNVNMFNSAQMAGILRHMSPERTPNYDFLSNEKRVAELRTYFSKLADQAQEDHIAFILNIIGMLDDEHHAVIGAAAMNQEAPPSYFLTQYLDHLNTMDDSDKAHEVMSTWYAEHDNWQELLQEEIQQYFDEEQERGSYDEARPKGRMTAARGEQHLHEQPKQPKREPMKTEDEGIEQVFDEPLSPPDKDLMDQLRNLLGHLGKDN